MINAGLDIGFWATKLVAGRRRVQFPSAVGTPDKPRFSLTPQDQALILRQPRHVQVGQAAIEQSRFLHRREDREWILSNEWYDLFAAAATELTKASGVNLQVITGLPVDFYSRDHKTVQDRLLGAHRLQREGHHVQTITVANCRVVPQPFGILAAAVLNDRGYIVDSDLATGTAGVIDVGGKTTNLLSVKGLREVGRETASVNVGAWDMVRAIRVWLAQECPELELRDHEVIQAVIARQVNYFGDKVDLTHIANHTISPLADQVIAAAGQLWNGGAALDGILVGGGGALLLGGHIQGHFRHARITDDPVFANALGFYRLAQWMDQHR